MFNIYMYGLFYYIIILYIFICMLIHFAYKRRKMRDCSNLRINSWGKKQKQTLLWFSIACHCSKDRRQSFSDLKAHFSVIHCVLLYSVALSSILTESGQRAHLSLLVCIVSCWWKCTLPVVQYWACKISYANDSGLLSWICHISSLWVLNIILYLQCKSQVKHWLCF